MGFSIKVEANINIPADLRKVDNNTFWKYAASEWHRLISPYTPMRSGPLRNNVKINPKEIEYKSPYAHYIYKGELMVDPDTGSAWAKHGAKKVYAGKQLNISKEKNPLASIEWDKAARPTQEPELIRSLQGYIDSGRLGLDD